MFADSEFLLVGPESPSDSCERIRDSEDFETLEVFRLGVSRLRGSRGLSGLGEGSISLAPSMLATSNQQLFPFLAICIVLFERATLVCFWQKVLAKGERRKGLLSGRAWVRAEAILQMRDEVLGLGSG